jgi:hypothetical protein
VLLLALGLGCGSGEGPGTDADTRAEAEESGSESVEGEGEVDGSASEDTGDGDGEGDGVHDAGDGDGGSGDGDGDGELVVWPLSASPEPDADVVRHAYGPRWIGVYDFHAGIDINAPTGTDVHAIAAGEVVDVEEWDGMSAAGSNVLVAHSEDRYTAYLHLSSIDVLVGQQLAAGEKLGEVGDTGASTEHLHLTYMVGLETPLADERKSRNPMEWLPHTELALSATPVDDGWTVTVPEQAMTVARIEMSGGTETHDAHYYDIVAKGSVERDEPVHFGVEFGADGPDMTGGSFLLRLAPDPIEADLSLRIWDFADQLLLELP